MTDYETTCETRFETDRQKDKRTDRQTAKLTFLKIWKMLKEHVKGQVWVKDWIYIKEKATNLIFHLKTFFCV